MRGGIFGTTSWTGDNPFKADGRDVLPALRRFRGEVRAHELTTWGTIWRLGAIVLMVVGYAALVFMIPLL